ncbi:MAG: 50S ribosomal protein L11 methyltransferase [Eubacterium sp.]|nr:50S ribosomal protein L11 methyltransferase [Eubacterium sp.]
MKWTRYTIKTTVEAEDIVSAGLMELGIQGVEIEDKVPLSPEEKSGMFIDIAPDIGPDDGISFLSFYLSSEDDNSSLIEDVKAFLEETGTYCNVGECTITVSEADEDDFLNRWKEYFHAFKVGDILIKPTFEDADTQGAQTVIEIDPGTSFGTGKHETTKLCILGIQNYVNQNTAPEFLDVGAGSGILSLIALKLGASGAVCLDIDENCRHSVEENMDQNGIARDRWEFMARDLTVDADLGDLCPEGGFPVIAANILAEVIVPMAHSLYSLCADGGVLLTSGILAEKRQMVSDALEEAGFTIERVESMGDWVGIFARK